MLISNQPERPGNDTKSPVFFDRSAIVISSFPAIELKLLKSSNLTSRMICEDTKCFKMNRAINYVA